MGNSAMPPYLKMMAAAVLVATYGAALAYACYHYAVTPSTPLPTEVSIVLGSGLTIALTVIGMHSGATLAETPPSSSNVTPGPTGQATMVPAPPTAPPSSSAGTYAQP